MPTFPAETPESLLGVAADVEQLKVALPSEADARLAGDAANADAIATLSNARQTGDEALGARIDGEAAARLEAFDAVDERIGNEILARVDGDNLNFARHDLLALQLTQALGEAVAVATWPDIDGLDKGKLKFGQAGKVYGPDAGQHNDPVSGQPVNNEGVYTLVAEGWKRLGNLEVADSAAQVTLARRYAVSTDDVPMVGAIDPADRGAAFHANRSQLWAEGDYPGGVLTRSSRSWAGESQVGAELALARAAIGNDGRSQAKIALDLITMLQAKIALLENTAAASPAVWITAAAIGTEGWDFSFIMASARTGGVINATKVGVRAYSMGFDEFGAPITRMRTLRASSIKRKSVPNQALKEDTVAGAITTVTGTLVGTGGDLGWVYAKDKNGGTATSGRDPELVLEKGWLTVGGVEAPGQVIVMTNNSAKPYPEIRANWNIVPFQASGNTVRLEFVGRGTGARDRRPLACVKFSAKGRTSGITTPVATIAAFTVSNWRTSTAASMAFVNDHDVTALTQGEMADARAVAYPFVGDTPVDTDLVAFPSHLPCKLPFIVNRTGALPHIYASWAPTTGNDGTGAVSTVSEAAAEATPFASFQRLMYAVHTAAAGNNNVLIEVIGKDAGDYVLNMKATDPAAPSVVFATADWTLSLNSWAIIRPKAGVAANLSSSGAASTSQLPSMFCNRMPGKATGTGGGSIICEGGETTVEGTKHFWWDAPHTGFGDASNPAFASFSWEYLTGAVCTTPGRILMPKGTQANNIKLVRNVDIDVHVGNSSAHVINGLHVAQCNAIVVGQTGAGSNARSVDGQIAINIVALKCSGEAINLTEARTKGFWFGNIVLEAIQTTQPVLGVNRDGNLNATKGHYLDNITTVGSRANYNYEDAATLAGTGQVKEGEAFINSIIWALYAKSDYFALTAFPGTAGGNIHTWATRYHVQFRDNSYLTASYAIATPGYNNELGEVLAEGERLLNIDPSSGYFSNYRATAALGGGGTYVPIHADLMGVSRQVFAADVFGTARDMNLATAARGAVEHA